MATTTKTTKTRARKPRTTAKPKPKPQHGPDLSILLPTWNNAAILWLQLESLLRQETQHTYEVLVMECPVSGGYPSEGLITDYAAKFKDRGVDLRYIKLPRRLLLVDKWRELAKAALSERVLMVASDNYTSKFAVEAYVYAFEHGATWVDCPVGWFYDIRSRKMAEFRAPKDKTGLLFAALRAEVAKLPVTEITSSIDYFIRIHAGGDQVSHVTFEDGILTDGYNSISHHRAAKYAGLHRRPPFYDVDCTLYDRLPADIAARLEKMKPIVVG